MIRRLNAFFFFQIIWITFVYSNALTYDFSVTQDKIILGIFPNKASEMILFIKDDKRYIINKSGKVTDYGTHNINIDDLSLNIKGSENNIIASFGEHLLYLLDSQLSVTQTPIEYDDIDSSLISGSTVLEISNNQVMIAFGTFDGSKFSGYMKFYKILSSLSFKLLRSLTFSLTITKKPEAYLSCKYFESGKSIVCGYQDDGKIKISIISKGTSSVIFKNPITLSSGEGLKLIRITEELLSLVYYGSKVNVQFYKVSNGALTSPGKNSASSYAKSLDFVPTSKTFTAIKNDEYSIIVLEYKDGSSKIVFHFISFVEEEVLSNSFEFDAEANLLQITIESFGSSLFNLLYKRKTGPINGYIFSIPQCFDVFRGAYSQESIVISFKDISPDSSISIKEHKVNNGNVVVTSDTIQYTAGNNGKAIIEYVVAVDNYASRTCRITIQICNPFCGMCNEYSEDSGNPKCNSCASNEYAEVEGDKTKCFNKKNGQDGYFFENNKFYQCHNSCKRCSGQGTENDTKCISCYDGFTMTSTSCICDTTKAPWYEENGNKICVGECPEKYPLKMEDTNECVKNCLDNKLIYGKTCVSQCPSETVEKNLTCVKQEEIDDDDSDLIKDDDSLKEALNKIENNIIDYSKNQPTGNIKEGTYQIYENSEEGRKNAEENYKNLSRIDLGECETILKEKYSIGKNENLLIFKIDIKREDQLSNQVEYSVYSPSGEKLDLSLCENVKITISSSINEGLESQLNLTQAKEFMELGYDIYNSNDPFYTDICTPYTTEDKTDIPLEDRKKDIYKNVSFCEEGCEYSKMNLTEKRIECQCNVKTNVSETSSSFSFNKLSNAFKKILSNSNIKVVKCYKLVFSKNLSKNAGSWILIVLIAAEIAPLVLYSISGIKPITRIVQDIIEKISTKDSERKEILSAPPTKSKSQKKVIFDQGVKFNLNDNEDYNFGPEIKIIEEIQKNFENEKTSYNDQDNRSVGYSLKKKKHKGQKAVKTEETLPNNNEKEEPSLIEISSHRKRKVIHNTFVTENSRQSKNSLISSIDSVGQAEFKQNSIDKITGPYSSSNIKLQGNDFSSITKYDSKIEINKPYSDEEYNMMDYSEAIKNDKRSFLRYYYSLLKYDQIVIFTFFNPTDFNLKLLKITMFIFCIAMYLTFNTLFYTDSTMSYNYHHKGTFDFIYSLPKILFSTIICALINFLLKFLSLSQIQIFKLKKIKELSKAEEFSNKVLKFLKLKVIIFFSLIFIFLVLFWYYVSSFCSVYVNTQKHLLLDTLISFIMSLVYPFIICLVTACVRRLALSKKSKCLFETSKILQFF